MIKGVRYYSVLGSCGYGDAALAYIKGIMDQGIPLQWSPLVWTQWGIAPWHMLPDKHRPVLKDVETGSHKRDEIIRCLEEEINYDTVIIHYTPELWPKLVEPDKINIGYTVWETDRLPLHWPDLLHCVDHICVPCTYNQTLFSIDHGPTISIVPHAIRYSMHDISSMECTEFKLGLGIPEDVYVFYTIAAWDPRKAMVETLHAYLKEFSADEEVCLLIKTDEEGFLDGYAGIKRPVRMIIDDIISSYSNPAKVVLIAGRIPERQVQLIHEIGDCFYSLTHCEGWGLGAFDAASFGNQVIITGWGGQLDFLPPNYSYHVKYDLKKVKVTAGWESYDSGQQWAYADIDDARRQLRYVLKNQHEAKEKGQKLKAFVGERFSIEQVTTSFLASIHEAHSS